MRLTFLGTGAAEGYPNPFCRCANCEGARALGGPSLRRRSAALIDDDLLIDLGPDIGSAAAGLGLSLAGVRHCLQTHAHADHLDTSFLLARTVEYGVAGAPRLHLYASPASARLAARLLERDLAPGHLLDPAVGERLNLTIHQVAPCRSFAVGRYRVTALAANHDPGVEPLLFVIEADDRAIFYATDTGPLPEATWRALGRLGRPLDVVILDHSNGLGPDGEHHLSARQFLAQVERLRAAGLLAAGARVLAHHLAHDANPPHPALAALAARHGHEVAHDGLTL
jgi:phosphoribosyl 1,2-cyclic phosphate phosphodiesterase